MANIKISGLPDAILPLDGPNSFFEVQTIEAGVEVSRKIASDDINLSSAIIIEDEGVPLAGGADTLNFVGAGVAASGVGSTKVITIPGGGQVDSVVSGVNITIDPSDPINPIANLDASITGMTINGVVLSDAGAATSYLDETGAYSVPPSSGGQVDSVVGGTNISVNVADPINPIVNLDAAITGVSVDGVTLTAAGVATNYLDETGAYSVPAGGGGGVATYNGRSGAVIALSSDWNINTTITALWQIDDADFRLINSTDLRLFSAGDTEDVRFSLTASLMQVTGSGFNPPDLSFQIQNWVGFDVNVQSYFQPSVTVGGNSNPGSGASINIAHGAVPSSPLDGDVWTTTAGYFARINGVTIDLAAGSLTPWTSDIDGAGFNLDGAGVIFLVKQLASDPDVAGQGQIWVEGIDGDPLWAEVEMLADMEGPDGATSYTEVSTNAAVATFNGTAELDTAEFNSGTSSLLLDGNSDWITFPDIAAYDLGTQDWTIEGFVRFNTLPPLQTSAGPGFVLYDSRRAGSALVQYGIIQDAFGFRVRLVGQDWGAEVGTIVGGILTNTWYHWAVTRSSTDNNIRAYFNGLYEVADFGVSPADIGNPDAPIIIGCRDATDAFTDGWIDDVRVTIGTARYFGTGAYSVPSTPYLMAAPPTDLFFTDDTGVDFQLNGGGASSLQATMAVGNTTTIDLEITTGAALTIFDAADVDSVSVEINTTTMAPAEALVFLASANVEVYSFDEGINIDNGDLNLNLGSVNFYRFGDSVSSSLGSDGTDIRMQIVGGTSTFFVQADSIRQSEAAAPAPNIAGRGQWWTRSSAPCRPTYTDDTDVDQLLDPSISEIISVVASRTGVLTDKGKTVAFTGGTVAQTMTIPASGAVAFQIGTLLAWDNSGSVSISIAITTDTLIFADDNSTGTRTLAAGGAAVAQLVGAGVWKIAGAGLS